MNKYIPLLPQQDATMYEFYVARIPMPRLHRLARASSLVETAPGPTQTFGAASTHLPEFIDFKLFGVAVLNSGK